MHVVFMAITASGNFLNVSLIVLYDSDKKLLFQHRTPDAPTLPGYWAFFGGSIEDGESPEEAVCREAREELNCELKSPELFMERDFTIDDKMGHMYVFIHPFYGDKTGLELREGQGWGWYKATETNCLNMIGHDREMVEKISEHIGGPGGGRNA